jgi:hypothetical protein
MNEAAPTPAQRFSFFHALSLSFVSKEFYVDVGRAWKGIGFGYLLFLLAVAWIPLVVRIHAGFQHFLKNDAPKIIAQLPAIHITKGEVQADPPGRHEIKDPGTGRLMVLIDPSIEGLPEQIPEDSVVLTRSRLIVRERRGQTRIQDLAGVESFSMTREDAARWLETAGRWLAVVFYPFALLFSFLYRAVQVLIYAAIGIAFANAAKAGLSYPDLMRITAVAITPAVLVDVLRELLAIPIPMWWLLCFIIAMFYLHFAIHAIRDAEAATAAAPPPPSPPGFAG